MGGVVAVAAAIALVSSADDADVGKDKDDDAPSLAVYLHKGEVTTQDLKRELPPCTEREQPTNFEVYSAGPQVSGLPVTETLRTCENDQPHAGELPANYVSYIYGDCPYRKAGEGGCPPPLAIQTWPACQRSLATYTFNGKPFPHQDVTDDLSLEGGARVVYFDVFGEPRLEVYTKDATIVVYARSSALAIKAIENLRAHDPGTPPARFDNELEGEPEDLAPPLPGATKGQLRCD
ncbi:MAG TPA: hypothetical protein VGG03_09810 [Thermoanaerobaculia bacterium]